MLNLGCCWLICILTFILSDDIHICRSRQNAHNMSISIVQFGIISVIEVVCTVCWQWPSICILNPSLEHSGLVLGRLSSLLGSDSTLQCDACSVGYSTHPYICLTVSIGLENLWLNYTSYACTNFVNWQGSGKKLSSTNLPRLHSIFPLKGK